MPKMKQLTHRLKGSDGAEIAEAALVLPIVFMLLLGIVWFGRAFNIYSTITQAAQQGAIVAARPTCATCTNAFPTASTVATTVKNVMQASSLDPNQIVSITTPPTTTYCGTVTPPCQISSNIAICTQVMLNKPGSSPQPAVCGTTVSFQYPFKFYLPFTSLNMQQVTLSAQAQSRMEN